MRSLLAFSALLSLAACNPEWATNPPTLDPNAPIYLAHVFFPPEMRFVAYTPPKTTEGLHALDPLDWCVNGIDVTDSVSTGSRTPPFTLEGFDGLKIHDFFTDRAYLSRHNERAADCYITPMNWDIGFCPGAKELGQQLTGRGVRTWSCWLVKNKKDRKGVVGPREDFELDKQSSTKEGVFDEAVSTTAMVGSSVNIAFTAAATGWS